MNFMYKLHASKNDLNCVLCPFESWRTLLHAGSEKPELVDKVYICSQNIQFFFGKTGTLLVLELHQSNGVGSALDQCLQRAGNYY